MSAHKPSSLGGVDRLYKIAKLKIPGLRREDIIRFLEGQFAYSQHRPVRRKFSRRKVIATDIHDVYQMDLADMQKFSEFNDGFKYILVIIDCFSKYVCAIPVKNKTPQEIVRGLTVAFKEYGICAKVYSDNGKEFKNKIVSSFLKELNVWQWFSSNDDTKAQMCERVIRTIKQRLWVYMTEKDGYRYIDILQDVVKAYNESEHSSTGFSPNNIDAKAVEKIREKMSKPMVSSKPKFKIDDHVRLSKNKLTFEKDYETNYTDLIYKIVDVRRSDNFYIYQVVDLHDDPIKGWFYEEELSKTHIAKYPKFHRIAKILRERKKKGVTEYLIRWSGYPSAFDSWEKKDDIE